MIFFDQLLMIAMLINPLHTYRDVNPIQRIESLYADNIVSLVEVYYAYSVLR